MRKSNKTYGKVANSAIAEFATFKNKQIIRAKKSLGQNFLKSQLALSKIVEAGEIKSDLPAQAGDVILEIGPGKGALTRKLLEKAGLVIAVEKDRELFEFLKTKFEKEIKIKKLILLNEDILEFEVSEEVSKFLLDPRNSLSLSQPDHAKNLKHLHYKVIANIPYNITGAILKKFLTNKNQPSLMVLMAQHEVAKRITTPSPSSERRGGKESLLSISVKAYGEPKMIMKVPARYFTPAPKVDSAVILIQNISRDRFPPSLIKEGVGGGNSKENHLASGTPPPKGGEDFETKFWEIVKAGFAHKRKKLSSNLKILSKNNKYGGVASVGSVENLGNKRAEDLTLEDWIKLTKECNS